VPKCVVRVDGSQGRRGRDTGSYVDRGERREAPPGRRTWVPDSRRRTLGAVAQCSGLQLPLNAEPQPGWRNGIRGRLKPVCPQGHRGSTPLSGTFSVGCPRDFSVGPAWANHPPSQARAPARPNHGPTRVPPRSHARSRPLRAGSNPYGLAHNSNHLQRRADAADADHVGVAGDPRRRAGDNHHPLAFGEAAGLDQRLVDLTDHVVGVADHGDHE
jgi:hypothetical protein